MGVLASSSIPGRRKCNVYPRTSAYYLMHDISAFLFYVDHHSTLRRSGRDHSSYLSSVYTSQEPLRLSTLTASLKSTPLQNTLIADDDRQKPKQFSPRNETLRMLSVIEETIKHLRRMPRNLWVARENSMSLSKELTCKSSPWTPR